MKINQKFTLSAILAGTLMTANAAPATFGRRTASPDVAQLPAKAVKSSSLAFRAVTLPETKSQEDVNGLVGYPAAPVLKRPQLKPERNLVRAAAAITPDLELRGSVIGSSNPDFAAGMYNIPTVQGGEFTLLGSGVTVNYGAYDDGNGNFYVAGMEDWGMGYVIPYLLIYDSNTWQRTGEVDSCDLSILCTDNAVDPTSGNVYGCYYTEDGSGMCWAQANYAAGTSTPIRTLSADEKMWGVACDERGQYYAILENGNLVAVDKTTGRLTVVGSTGLLPYYSTSATYDTKSSQILFAYSPLAATGALWTVDPVTAESHLALGFRDRQQVTNLTVIGEGADPSAPAAPRFEVTTSQGKMSANYKLWMPVSNVDGSDGSVRLDYSIMLDGVTVKEGIAQKGQPLSGVIEVAEPGMHSFAAVASNEVGLGARTMVNLYVGPGVPSAPQGVKAVTNADNTISLTWDAVTTSADGGYIDPAEVTYVIYRGGTEIASGIQSTSYMDTPPMPEKYVKMEYEVAAYARDRESATASCVTGLGAMTPPYACTFGTDNSDDNLYTSYNLNEDESYWYYSPYYACFKVDYVTDAKNDDWLISPAFNLEAGKVYELSYIIFAGSSMYEEDYSLAMGRANDPAAMTTMLLENQHLTNSPENPATVKVSIRPEESGHYYIGWYAQSADPCFMIRLEGIEMSAGLSLKSPAEVTDVQLTPDIDGHLVVTGGLKAPAVNFLGDPLQSNCNVEVRRNDLGEPVTVFTNVAPGSALTFTDSNISASGDYTYEFITESVDGNPGRSVKKSIYVGPTAPNPVTNVQVKETETPGTVLLTWDAPAETVDGRPLKSENLTYMVYTPNGYQPAIEMLPEPVSECKAIVKVCEPSEASFAILYVESINLGLSAEEWCRCQMIPVGRTAEIPYRQSFNASDRGRNAVGIYTPDGSYASWSVGSPASPGYASQDGDDAYLYLECDTQYAQPAFYTGKIDLRDVANPALSLYHYVLSSSDANMFEVIVVTEDGTPHSVGLVDHSDDYHDGWNLALFSLEEFKGQVVYIVVNTVIVSHNEMAFDNLKVGEMPQTDLAATALALPSVVAPERPFAVKATVANLGIQPVEKYTVSLMHDGEKVLDIDVPHALQPGAETYVDFEYTLSPMVDSDPDFSVVVAAPGDSNSGNDESPIVSVTLKVPAWPAVNDLEAVRTDEGVALEWSTPSTSGFDAKEVESFEDADAWSDDVDGWTMVDWDEQQIGGVDAVGLPSVVGARTRHAFFVFDNQADDIVYYDSALKPLLAAHSGSKTIATIYTINPNVEQDDWAISPLLCGEAQTVSFYARSYHPDYLDSLEVLYSLSDSTNPEDFVSLCPDGAFEVPQLVDEYGAAAYTYYEFNLPEGAVRMAFRVHNPVGEGYILMIDDVKLKQAYQTLEVTGYKVYRDGVCITDRPIDATDYLDKEADAGAHTYHVAVVYNRGISTASNGAYVKSSGMDAVTGEAVAIFAERNAIVVKGIAADERVTVCSTDGKLLYTGFGPAKVTLPAGVYTVAAGAKTVKLIVR